MVRRSGVAEPPHPVLTGFSLSGPVPTNTLKVPHIRKDFSPISLTISLITFHTTTPLLTTYKNSFYIIEMSTIDAAIIKHITEGGATGSGGGSEDILKRIPDQTITMTEESYGTLLDITLPTGLYFYSGCVLRLYNKTTQEYDDIMLIRDSKERSSTPSGRGNSYLFIKNETASTNRAEVYGSNSEKLSVIIDNVGIGEHYKCNQMEYPEVGIYEYENMSFETYRLLLMRPFFY